VLQPNSTRSHQGCCSAADAADARFVSGMLGIPFYALNFQEDFDGIIDYFADEYAKGRTPNPCVVCNDRLKFGRLFEYADAIGARFVATGHYARVGMHNHQPALRRAIDTNKDQTYVLFGLRRELLSRVLFPIGHLTKSEVRAVAERMGFPNHDKPDSVEICFAPDRDYARIVRQRRPDAFAGGEVVDSTGSVIGRHEGLANYTVGQRRGLRIAAGKPIYVTQLDVVNNRVVTGDDQALLCGALIADRANLLLDPDVEGFRADVKIRYLHTAASATVQRLPHNRVRVVFDEPQRAVTPGQAVVFYDGDLVVGGAWIERGEPTAHRAPQEAAVAS
jgi:tRNA-specific 2-thiouridylase